MTAHLQALSETCHSCYEILSVSLPHPVCGSEKQSPKQTISIVPTQHSALATWTQLVCKLKKHRRVPCRKLHPRKENTPQGENNCCFKESATLQASCSQQDCQIKKKIKIKICQHVTELAGCKSSRWEVYSKMQKDC